LYVDPTVYDKLTAVGLTLIVIASVVVAQVTEVVPQDGVVLPDNIFTLNIEGFTFSHWEVLQLLQFSKCQLQHSSLELP